MKRMILVTLGMSALTALVVGNAYAQKGQFYTTVVYLLNSNRTLGILYLQAAVMVWLTTTLVKKLFFGTLTAAEVEHLIEKSWYMVLETFILLAGFHEDMQVGFVATITFLFVVKGFHWLIEERINYMERSPLITWTFHLRAITIIFLLAGIDLLCMKHSWNSLRTKGASVLIVFGLEYAIMLLVATNTFLHYLLHAIDLRSEDPWENKTIYMRYIDIVIGFLKLLLYISYMIFMMWILFIPLHIARRIFITAKHFQKSVHDVLSSHQAIRNLNTLYPDATEEELQAANAVCIICREDMVQRCKKLPCKHIFHTTCLRSWFQRQQVCPTCRMDVLRHSATMAHRNRRLQQQDQAQAAVRAGAGVQGIPPPPGPGAGGMFNPMMGPPPLPHMWAPHPGMVPPVVPPPPPQPPNTANPPGEGANNEDTTQNTTQLDNTAGTEDQANNQGGSTAQTSPPQSQGAGAAGAANTHTSPQTHPFPTTFMPPPFGIPPAMFGIHPSSFGITGSMQGSPSLAGLTEDELRSLEGMERGNVEARIVVLRNIQRLLDTAVTQMTQYSVVMASLGSVAGPGFPGHPYPPEGPPPPPGTTTTSSPDSQSSQPQPNITPGQPTSPLQPPSTATVASPPRQLVEGERDFSFTAGELEPTREEEGDEQGEEGESGLFTIGGVDSSSNDLAEKEREEQKSNEGAQTEASSSPSHVDELRQRRLQRFHSMPNTTSSTVDTDSVNKPETERTDQ